MKIAIIEDEIPAAEKLQRYLLKYDEEIEVMTQLSSIQLAVEWLSIHQSKLDLIFMDIQLTDGLSFEIFSEVKITKPVIFVTAFDEYAIDAFKVNSIDYILKPITFINLSNALKKFKTLKAQFSQEPNLEKAVNQIYQKKYKERFLVKLGNHIHSIKTTDIALFFAEGRTVYLITMGNKKFILNFKLEDLEDLLDKKMFFRVNRTFIININAIKDVLIYSNSRLNIAANIKIEKEIIVSRDKVNPFKAWLEGN